MSFEREAVLLKGKNAKRVSYSHDPATGISTLIRHWNRIEDSIAESCVAYLNSLGASCTNPKANGKEYTGTWRVVQNRVGRLLAPASSQGVYQILTLGSHLLESQIVERRLGVWVYRTWVFDDDSAPSLPANELTEADLALRANPTKPLEEPGDDPAGVAPTAVVYGLGQIGYNPERGTWSGSVEKALFFPVENLATSVSADTFSVRTSARHDNMAEPLAHKEYNPDTGENAGLIHQAQNSLGPEGLYLQSESQDVVAGVEWDYTYPTDGGTVWVWGGVGVPLSAVTAARVSAGLQTEEGAPIEQSVNVRFRREYSRYPGRYDYSITLSPKRGGGSSTVFSNGTWTEQEREYHTEWGNDGTVKSKWKRTITYSMDGRFFPTFTHAAAFVSGSKERTRPTQHGRKWKALKTTSISEGTWTEI